MKLQNKYPPSSHTSSNSHTTQAYSPTTGFKHWLPQSTPKSLKSDPASNRTMYPSQSYGTHYCNIRQHLHKHDSILHFQHGIRPGLTCESQLIETVHDWMTALYNKTQIDAILLDFAKVFDKVPHKRLLSKIT